MYVFYQLSVPFNKISADQQQDLPVVRHELGRALKLSPEQLQDVEILRMSLDSRKRSKSCWSVQVRFKTAKKIQHAQVKPEQSRQPPQEKALQGSLDLPEQVVVIGAGPAGYWAAISLARQGYRVALHEQGEPVEERFRKIRRFLKLREFDPYSNVLFGEGGAGAFSDGKLTSRTRGMFTDQVLQDLAAAGGGPRVRYWAKPHLGTDRLHGILKNLRQLFLDLGGKVFFGSRLTDLEFASLQGDQLEVRRVCFNGQWQSCEALVLATGHSSRDLYELLFQRGVRLEPKPFAMGVRVEHPQAVIGFQNQQAREYVLTAQTQGGLQAAWSFCMCPGGVLVPCASEPGGFATNGMSYSRRNAPFANSGIVVPVAPLSSESTPQLWLGMQQQRQWEQQAFEIGGRNYTAPAQSIQAFINQQGDERLPRSSYPCGLTASNHWEWLPASVCETLAEAFEIYERKIPGFIEHGLMVSPETRTSSPLRIPRQPHLSSVNVHNLFPLGEGAGYTGGIVSSGADGVRLGYYAKSRRPL